MSHSHDLPACTLCQGMCNWACFAKDDPHAVFQEGQLATETLEKFLLDCSPPPPIVPEIPDPEVGA